ncbi:hypothetical protein GCM10027271_32770 [Saccharopolyspora gloriosae]|uniref:Uncharacterized protein n=1 Tax=Saccharopolyspora gloriosae TaxID=455344 RepID=A0A840NC09_9PSEU|nr:hypothetical protein [Saccharopolyspora gloriosae]MBB5069826.1 hypothetical protein [Saccharopolyspora gloriosae]
MRSTARLLVAATAAILAAGFPAATAAAASSGQVLIFSTELEPVTTYDTPNGCYRAPLTAHVLINETDSPVRIYGDPFCMTASLVVAPGHGAHVPPGTGSFQA